MGMPDDAWLAWQGTVDPGSVMETLPGMGGGQAASSRRESELLFIASKNNKKHVHVG